MNEIGKTGVVIGLGFLLGFLLVMLFRKPPEMTIRHIHEYATLPPELNN